MPETFQAAIPIVAAVLLGWVTWRVWRRKNPLLKWGGTSIAALLSLITAATGVLAVIGLLKLEARSAPPIDLKVAGTAEQVHRGRQIADGFCSGCHSPNGNLTGGFDLGDHLPLPLGSFVAANLTATGPLHRWSDGDIFRAIRNSVGPDGHWLIMMSYTNASKLSDDDTLAVIAYLRTLPAAGADTGPTPDHLTLLGLVMLGAGMMPEGKPIMHGIVNAPPKAPTAEFGEYILSYQDCRECHGKTLSGGTPGQLAPLGPDLGVVKSWSFDEFVATFRTGIDPSGHALGKEMPWQPIGRMDNDELRAIYEYLLQLHGT